MLQAVLPARAATEGMAGASRASANTRLYVRPKVVLPKRETMPYAIRLPRPDLMKPPDSQKAMAINHLSGAKTRSLADCRQHLRCQIALSHIDSYGISLEKALKAAAKVRVLVSIVAPSPIIATAPKGSGLVMIPTIVPRKMASRCHAGSVTPDGGGMNQITTARPTEMPKFFMSAPHLNSAGGAEAVALTTGCLLESHRTAGLLLFSCCPFTSRCRRVLTGNWLTTTGTIEAHRPRCLAAFNRRRGWREAGNKTLWCSRCPTGNIMASRRMLRFNC